MEVSKRVVITYLKKCNRIQHIAMRCFLGVHKYTPIYGLQRDIGWFTLSVDRSVYMVIFWNRLININNDRLTKCVFLWDYHSMS